LGDRHPDFRYVTWVNFLAKCFWEKGMVSTV
jgi:hypothetical protein